MSRLQPPFQRSPKNKNNKGHDPEDAGTNVNFNVVYFYVHLGIHQNLTTLHTRHPLPVAVWNMSVFEVGGARSKSTSVSLGIKVSPRIESTCGIVALIELDVYIFIFTYLLKNINIYIYIHTFLFMICTVYWNIVEIRLWFYSFNIIIWYLCWSKLVFSMVCKWCIPFFLCPPNKKSKGFMKVSYDKTTTTIWSTK